MAMCTADGSPQSPNNVQRFSASWLTAKFQTSGLTTTRGHGRWFCLFPASMRSIRDGMRVSLRLSEDIGHMLEPGHERRRKIDPGGKYQRQMRVHRNIGCLSGLSAASRLAERNAGQPQ